MRAAAASLFLIGLSQLRRGADGHPLCYFDDRPTDFEEVLTFCPEPQDGACCNDAEEAMVEAIFEAQLPLSEECAGYYKQVVKVEGGNDEYVLLMSWADETCAHLYEVLGRELGNDGMMMKNDFCTELVSACMGEINFPTYEDMDYCTKHTGGGKDMFWSYPYTEAAIFDSGLTEFFDEGAGIPSDAVALHMSPDKSVWWVCGIGGEIVEISAGDLRTRKLVMDMSEHPDLKLSKEEGLLNFAFGPSFHSNSRFYVSFTVKGGAGGHNRLSRFDYDYGSAAATLASEEILLESTERTSTVHTAGWLGFKPSSYYSSALSHDLYWGQGDSGNQEDPDNHGQNAMDMHGTMVRITVPTDGGGYSVPSGNYKGGMPEVCAIGIRNPWKCSFDRETEELYCGDVGQTRVETIKIIECGKNYGWGQFEGSRCQEATQYRFDSCADADRSDITFPWYEYCHPDYYSDGADEADFVDGVDVCGSRAVTGFAVIGGYVYRGNYFADVLYGAYIFGDAQTANIYYVRKDSGSGAMMVGSIISDGTVSPVAFGEDAAGELYVIDGEYKIYPLPCGDLCARTCLEQSDTKPTYESLGCFKDPATNRPLSIDAPACDEGKDGMSPDICASFCATQAGAVYFGVEFAKECFCGTAADDIAKHGEISASSCNMLCKGFPEATCGGKYAIEVFSIGDPDPTPSPVAIVAPESETVVTAPKYSYVGCFIDNPDRVLQGTYFPKLDTMTTTGCSILCAGSTFFGTQNGDECLCGESDNDYDALGEGTCDTACAGDSSETCGGKFALDVYLYDDADPVPGPTPVKTPDDYEYSGCYIDDGLNRVHSGAFFKEIPTMTPEDCNERCKGSPFFATEFGNECFCGMPGDDYAALGEGICNFDCAGDETQVCGGRDAMSVYVMKEYEPDTYSFLGCYRDDMVRVMSGTFKMKDPMMTLMSCAIFCEDSSTYFGLENADECWCGDATDIPDVYGEATCDDPCSGDDSERCGGHWALSVYQFDDAPVDPRPTPIVVPESRPRKVAATYMGCWSDTFDDRMMEEELVTDELTLELCESACEGRAFFGLQYGKECWCGDSDTDYEKYGEGVCTYECPGDQDELCGGRDSMRVYKY